ncbi:MFS transporter [Microbispora maris]|uniref:MFS transporter n=1 Tax=Microbispora maris TaxID=3144104 RepID=UPI003D153DC3
MLVAIDATALLLALPQLSADLGATGVEQLWISDSYGFMVAGLVIVMGTVGDRIGHRRLLLVGGAAFLVLSVVAAFVAGPSMLIVARALLGVAGATLAPSTLALLGVVAAAVYRSRMEGTSDSLAGAVAASRHLPAGQGAQLLQAAREAFTAGLHVTGVVAAVVFAGPAVLVLAMRPATRTAPAALPG